MVIVPQRAGLKKSLTIGPWGKTIQMNFERTDPTQSKGYGVLKRKMNVVHDLSGVSG